VENMPKGKEKTTTTTTCKELLRENITHNFKTPSSHTIQKINTIHDLIKVHLLVCELRTIHDFFL